MPCSAAMKSNWSGLGCRQGFREGFRLCEAIQISYGMVLSNQDFISSSLNAIWGAMAHTSHTFHT